MIQFTEMFNGFPLTATNSPYNMASFPGLATDGADFAVACYQAAFYQIGVVQIGAGREDSAFRAGGQNQPSLRSSSAICLGLKN